jgi:exosortase
LTAPAATLGGLAQRERVIAALLLLDFVPALIALARVWSSTEYLSHGFLVPLVSYWVLLRERPRRARVPREPAAAGLALVAAALVAYLLGIASSLVPLQAVALVAAIAGAVVWLRGWAWLRALAFPVGFLLFMAPPPASWITPLIVRLQEWVSIAAVEIVHRLGVAVLRTGNVLRLASGDELFVAEACSGVTSVITLAPLGVMLAYLSQRTRCGRLLLLLAVPPVAMLGNLTRVVLTVALSDRFGVAWVAEGPPHLMLGLVTYVVGCLALLACDAALRRWARQRP